MNQKKLFKGKENGITLIALVITIIVLLILAGVAISMLSGENGILKQAGNAKEQYSDAQQKEEQRIEDLAWEIAVQTDKTKLTMKEGILKFSNKTVKDINAELPDGYKVADQDGKIITDDTKTITTGMTIVKDNKIVSKVIVAEDVNKDNAINSTDAELVNKAVAGDAAGIELLKDAEAKASMDVNNDGKINVSDAALIKDLEEETINEFPNKGYTGGASSIKVERIVEIVSYDYELGIEVAEALINDGETIGDIQGKAIEEAAKATTYIKTGMTILRNNEIVGRIALIGDIDTDGHQLTAGDAIEIPAAINGTKSAIREDYHKVAADVNNDGKINLEDFQMIIDYTDWKIDEVERGDYNRGASLIVIEK